MVSRFLFRLRALLPALALAVICGSLTPGAVLAKTPYKYTDRTEGDPGDGVLSPIAQPSGGDKYDIPGSLLTTRQTDATMVTGIQLIFLPAGGGRLIIFLPTDWSRLTSFFSLAEGRAPHAP